MISIADPLIENPPSLVFHTSVMAYPRAIVLDTTPLKQHYVTGDVARDNI